MRNVLLFLTLVLVLGVAGCGSSDETANDGGEGNTPERVSSDVPSDAVALVGDAKLLKSDFEALLAQAEQSYEDQERDFPKPGTAEYETLKNQAVQFLVQRVQFAQEAQALGVTVADTDVDKRLEELKEQFFGGDEAEYTKQLEDQGLTEAQVLKDVRAQVVSEKIFEQVTKDVTVSDEEIQTYYDSNEAQFQQPETREVRHILVKKQDRAQGIYNQLQAGADFAELAKEFSQDPGSKEQGGELTIRKGETVAPFDKFSFSADTGVLSEPIKTQFGWHVIETISDVRPESVTPLAEVKDSIRQQLEQEQKNKAMTDWVENLREKYEGRIVYAVGYAPPPPSETTTGDTETGETEPTETIAPTGTLSTETSTSSSG